MTRQLRKWAARIGTAVLATGLLVGATHAAILLQFLGEAVMLCLAGGVLGSAGGVLGAHAAGDYLGWPVTVPEETLILAPAISMGVGVIFGLYPAWRAARLLPIDALHSE